MAHDEHQQLFFTVRHEDLETGVWPSKDYSWIRRTIREWRNPSAPDEIVYGEVVEEINLTHVRYAELN